MIDLQTKWNENAEFYKTVEIGGGVHDFVNDILSYPKLFALKLTPKKTSAKLSYVHDTESDVQGRPDFVLYIDTDITIPCEVKCYTRIEEGVRQLQRYRSDYTKEYGILTDGFTWRFYRSNSYEILELDQMLENPERFRTFWEHYLTPESYYLELFLPSGQGVFFDDSLNLNDQENRSLFFKETSKLIANFRTRIRIKDDKTALETAYSYLIQFILYKVLVDNRFKRFEDEYQRFQRQIVEAIQNQDLYNLIVLQIKNISEYISQNIYRPFVAEQQSVHEKLLSDLKRELTIQDIAPWLDIIVFLNKFDFSNLKNEIFGFVYENYLKDLYGEKNKGQFFTDPAVVNFMLDEMGYTADELVKDQTEISIIDPSCGAGTFLYSAVDRIIEAFGRKETQAESATIKELVDQNVFGLDIAEFPLYLAEMCILLRLLPLTVTELYDSPVEKKLKLFTTKDSISEFLDTGITAQDKPIDLLSHLDEAALDDFSFMRDDENLMEMLSSMQGNGHDRLRFDFVIGNPPYISYKDCSKQNVDFMRKIKERRLRMNHVFGVNLHSIPGNIKKYAPTPNLFAFFIALSFGLLKENGKVCLIVPQTILIAEALDVIRYHLANKVTIEKLITFEGKLFTGRGIKSNKAVPTSSLIFVASNRPPRDGHKVRVVNYGRCSEKQAYHFERYLKSRNKTSKSISQQELLAKVGNWNFIKHTDTDRRFCEQYAANSEDISCYYTHSESKKRYGTIFYFDRGLKYPKDKVKENAAKKNDVLLIPTKEKNCFVLGITEKSIDKKLLDFPHGSQGLDVYLQKYKIVWSYMNRDMFRFSQDPIMIDYNNVLISSDNQEEIRYLFALLNARVTCKIFDLFLFLENEQDLTIGIKSVKQYIRVPKITPKNKKSKAKIITLADAMLALEAVTLRDIVDFSNLSVQKFDDIRVEKNELILSNDKDFRLKIAGNHEELVKTITDEQYRNGRLLTGQTVSLTELKSLPAIDLKKRDAMKKEIDDLVYALYFAVSVKDIATHEFYDYVNLQRNVR